MKVRNKYLLAVVTTWGPLIALAVMFHLVVLEPQMQRVAALEAELTDARRLYSQATEAAKKENQIHLTETVERLSDRVSDFVLRLETAPDLAFEIAELASVTEVEAFAMRPRDKNGPERLPDCDRIAERQLNISFAASFHQFAGLLNALERHRPVLFVETFAVKRPREKTARPEIDMQLAILVEKPQGG